MSQARALSSDEVRGLAEELNSGGTPTVWFTASAVGVPEGRSGKVTALDDPPEGDFIQVRPAGSKDVLSFSAAEVTLVKPPRKRKESESSPSRTAPQAPATAAPASVPPDKPAPAKPAAAAAKPAPAPAKPAKNGEGAKETTSPTSGARRKPRQPTSATVTLTADETGQWNVEVVTGKKRVLRPTPVPVSAVAQAAKSLHDDVADAVEPLLDAARAQQRARVEQLQEELATAQRMLDELTE